MHIEKYKIIINKAITDWVSNILRPSSVLRFDKYVRFKAVLNAVRLYENI